MAAFKEWVDAGHLTEELLAAVSDRSASEQAIRDRRYQTPLVVHQLLARERPLRFQDPCRGLELAKLASGVARATMARAGTDWHRYGGLVARRWELAAMWLSSAVAGMAEVSAIETAYLQLLLACAHLGANEFAEANRNSIEAARFFSIAQVKSVALAAKQVRGEAARGAVTAASILGLVRAIEAAP